MSAHTPGPWRVGDAGHTIFRSDAPVAITNLAPSRILASAEVKANARLIAAAPALLWACEEIIAEHDARNAADMLIPGHGGYEDSAAVSFARLAVDLVNGISRPNSQSAAERGETP